MRGPSSVQCSSVIPSIRRDHGCGHVSRLLILPQKKYARVQAERSQQHNTSILTNQLPPEYKNRVLGACTLLSTLIRDAPKLRQSSNEHMNDCINHVNDCIHLDKRTSHSCINKFMKYVGSNLSAKYVAVHQHEPCHTSNEALQVFIKTPDTDWYLRVQYAVHRQL